MREQGAGATEPLIPRASALALARTLARIRGHAGPFLTTRDHAPDRAPRTPRTREPLGIARSLAEEEGFAPEAEPQAKRRQPDHPPPTQAGPLGPQRRRRDSNPRYPCEYAGFQILSRLLHEVAQTEIPENLRPPRPKIWHRAALSGTATKLPTKPATKRPSRFLVATWRARRSGWWRRWQRGRRRAWSWRRELVVVVVVGDDRVQRAVALVGALLTSRPTSKDLAATNGLRSPARRQRHVAPGRRKARPDPWWLSGQRLR